MIKAAGGDARLPVVLLTDASIGRTSLAVRCEKLMVYSKSRRLWREEEPRKDIMP